MLKTTRLFALSVGLLAAASVALAANTDNQPADQMQHEDMMKEGGMMNMMNMMDMMKRMGPMMDRCDEMMSDMRKHMDDMPKHSDDHDKG